MYRWNDIIRKRVVETEDVCRIISKVDVYMPSENISQKSLTEENQNNLISASASAFAEYVNMVSA